MMTYERYKESGVEGLGSIPEHWEINRVKNIGTINGRVGWKALKASEYVDKGYFFLSTPNIKDVLIDFKNVNYITKHRYYESPEIMLKVDDVLLVKDGSTLGIVNVIRDLPSEGTVNSSIAVLRIPKTNSIYWYYFFQSAFIQNFIQIKKDGMGVPHLFQRDIKNFDLLLPPLPEQQAIAQYLDTKTQAIDQKVRLLKQKIAYYKELRKSLINDAVTKGLDKTVQLKDSGIDCLPAGQAGIGQIPIHWEVERFKDSFDLKTGNSISDKGAYEVKGNAYFYVSTKDIDIDSGAVNYDNGLYVPKADKSFKRTKIDSTLICIEGANAGKKIGFTEKEICFVNKLCSVKGKKKIVHDKYYYYFINSKAFDNQFSSLISGLIGGVSINQIKFFNVLMPPTEEQTQIAAYLDQKTATIDKIIQNITHQIDRLKELRKTLINNVVTGKIQVYMPATKTNEA